MVGDRWELLLCPVREVKKYLRRTVEYCLDCRILFNSKMTSRNAISYWLRALFDNACRLASNSDCTVVKAKAHEK